MFLGCFDQHMDCEEYKGQGICDDVDHKIECMKTCGLCGKSYKYENNSPGNFGNHIKIEHSEKYLQVMRVLILQR